MTSRCHLAQHKYSFDDAVLFDVPACYHLVHLMLFHLFIYRNVNFNTNDLENLKRYVYKSREKCPLKNVC